MVFKCFSGVFANVFVSSVSFVFFCILQLLYLDISKIDQVLHIECMWEAACGANDRDDVRGGVGEVRGGTGLLLVRSLASPMRYTLVCSSARRRPNNSTLDGRPEASKSETINARPVGQMKL